MSSGYLLPKFLTCNEWHLAVYSTCRQLMKNRTLKASPFNVSLQGTPTVISCAPSLYGQWVEPINGSERVDSWCTIEPTGDVTQSKSENQY